MTESNEHASKAVSVMEQCLQASLFELGRAAKGVPDVEVALVGSFTYEALDGRKKHTYCSFHGLRTLDDRDEEFVRVSLRIAAGALNGAMFVSVLRDVEQPTNREIRRVRRALVKSIIELEELMREKGGLSHVIRDLGQRPSGVDGGGDGTE